MSSRQSYCVIREFREKDGNAVREIINEAAMETVGDFFKSAVFSEIFPQV